MLNASLQVMGSMPPIARFARLFLADAAFAQSSDDGARPYRPGAVIFPERSRCVPRRQQPASAAR